ncbi:MAG: outer membrane protein assembly factor BamC [Pseudomonadales bacterium]|nr:outer membrane protein assembly factor BamC [Pseudomonadales bacterium]
MLTGLALLALQSCSLFSWVPGMDRLAGDNGVFHDRKAEYLDAKTLPRTQIPEGLDSFVIDDLLVIPEVPGAADQTFLDPPRPRSLEGRSDREVVIQRMDRDSWIVVDVSPSQVWPRIRDYWGTQRIDIAFEDPTDGVMETGWFVRAGNVISRDRVRITVETGFQNNSSEIRLVQMSQAQATPAFDVAWPAASQEPDVETALVSALASYLADVADLYTASSVSFLAGNISSTGKATLEARQNGGEALLLQAPYERAWAAVARALQRGNVLIDTQDSGAGLFEVNYVPGSGDREKNKPGFFKRLFTFGNGITEPSALQVRLQRTNNGSIEVQVLPKNDAAAGKNANKAQAVPPATELLRLIRDTIA